MDQNKQILKDHSSPGLKVVSSAGLLKLSFYSSRILLHPLGYFYPLWKTRLLSKCFVSVVVLINAWSLLSIIATCLNSRPIWSTSKGWLPSICLLSNATGTFITTWVILLGCVPKNKVSPLKKSKYLQIMTLFQKGASK